MEGILKRLAYVSYPVTDWEGAKKFYSETLGLPVAAFISDEVGWMEFGEKEGTRLAISLWRGPDPKPAGSNGTAVFEVEDANKAVEELRRRGVKCGDAVGIPGMVTWADFWDPEGNRLQIAGPGPKA